MTKILVECPELLVSAELGVIGPLKPLEHTGLCQVQFLTTKEIRRRHIAWADILITVRGCETPTREIVSAAKQAGRFIIYYLDDDLLNIPEESIAWDYYNDPKIKDNILKILSMSDVLWGVNPNIREKYLAYTGGRWLQNQLPICRENVISAIPSLETPMKVLYAGSNDHQLLVQEILVSAIKRLSNEYGRDVEFTFIGADPGISNCENVRYIPFIKPYEEYRKFVEQEGFSIGLAPGRTTPFYSCKYYNKYVEYTSIGAAGVYTNAEPYTQIVRDGENGVLCENTPESWYSAIKRMLDDPTLRQTCRIQAQKQLVEDFEAGQVANQLAAQCPEICTFQAKIVREKDVLLKNGPFYFYLGRASMIWHSRGLMGIGTIFVKAIKVIFAICVNCFSERLLSVFIQYFKGIWTNRYILASLVQRDLQMKYRRSKLGVAWSILTPLGLAVIVGTVYAILFGTSPRELIPLIFASINPWIFMSGTADGATMAFPAAEGYIKQSTVASQIFPLRSTLVNFVTLLYSVLTFFGIYLLIEPNRFGPRMLLCIPGLIIMFLFTLGMANLTSVINLHLRDFAPFQSLIFQGLFYATPIIYDAQILAEKGFSIVYEVNPFYYMLEVVRKPMLGGALPDMRTYLISGVVAVAFFFAGVRVQMKAQKAIPYML